MIWSGFAVVSAVNIVTPGPANINTFNRAAELGARRVVPTILGNALGLAVGGMACASGVGAIVVGAPVMLAGFQLFGVIYLMWLGVKLIWGRATTQVAAVQVSARALWWEAFVLAVSNPKALLFYLALLPQVLRPDRPFWPQAVLLVGTYCALSILSLSSYALLAGAWRRRGISAQGYLWFRRLSGLVLIGFALHLVLHLWH